MVVVGLVVVIVLVVLMVVVANITSSCKLLTMDHVPLVVVNQG